MNQNIAKLIAIAALLYLFRKDIKEFLNPEPEYDPEIDDQGHCKHIIYQPFSPLFLHSSDVLPKGYCFRGDGYWDDKPHTTGDKYADEQAEEFKNKQEIDNELANLNYVAIVLQNTTDDDITQDIGDAIGDTDVWQGNLNGGPSGLVTSPISGGIQLDWSSTSTNETGFQIYKSTDRGTTYTLLDIVGRGVTTYQITGYESALYKVRAYNSAGVSDYTDEEGVMVIPLQSGGSQVATLRFTVSIDTEMSLSDVGRFYDDGAGTINEGTTRDITSGALRTFYLKLTSGTSSLTVHNITRLTQMGNATTVGWNSTASGPIISATFEPIDLGPNMTHFHVASSNYMSGDISGVPDSMLYFDISGSNTLSGDISDLPSGLTKLDIQGLNVVSGNIANLPSGLTGTLSLYGSNTVSGNISGLPDGITICNIFGNNTVSGDVADLPSGLLQLLVGGDNTISGDVGDLPSGLIVLYVDGNNTINGNVSGSPSTITSFTLLGLTTVTGDVSGLPSGITNLVVTGTNTLSGNVSGLPSTLLYFSVTGNNTITGDIMGLPSTILTINLTGNNTVSGDIVNLPSSMTSILITGNNTIDGDVADFPSTLISIRIDGSNTLQGDIADFPSVVQYIYIHGLNQLNTYTSGRSWASNMTRIDIIQDTGYGLDSTEVDNLLIDLASTTWPSGAVVLTTPNAARTATSDAAVTTLQGMGVTVTTA